MTIRRICTIGGRAYRLTDYCAVCGVPMWETLDTPTRTAGCTTTQCMTTAASTSPEPVPAPSVPDDDDDPWTSPV